MTPSAMPLNPFPGLRPFKPEESTLFFGRDEQIGEALDRLMSQKLLAVVGVSGCGKSSLVTAGMVPTLEMGLAGDPKQQWRIEIMRPGDGPLRELERCLGFGGGPLAERTYALREAVKVNLPADQNLLLVVDQFEELFPIRDRTREGGGNEADLFISYLLSAAQEPSARIYIILTMRSDYLGECAKFHGLPEALNDGQYLVPRMIRSQLQEAIESPLEAILGADGGAVQFHMGLVQKLLNDCDEEPDNLPLLQHLLRRLFEEWQKQGAGSQITPEMAREVGELSDALNKDAETVFKALSSEQQRIAEVLFRRITESRRNAGDTGNDRPVRRPQTVAHVAELAEVPEAALRDVIQCFEQRGLLVVRSTDELDKVDLPHECLCLKWNRLKEWIAKEAQDGKTLRFLADSVGQSHLTGAALDEAVAWQKAGRLKGLCGQRYLSPERLPQVDAWVTESKRRIDSLAEEKAKSARRLRVGFIAVAVLAIVTLGFGIGAVLLWSQTRQALVTAAYGLAATAEGLSKDFPDQSLLLALEARRRDPESKANGLLRAAAEAYPYRAVLRGHEASLHSAQFSLDGKTVLTASTDKTARLWDAATGKELHVLRGHTDEVFSAQFSADGKTVLTASYDKTVRLWDAATGKELRVLRGHTEAVQSAQFSPNGNTVLTASSDKTARLWNASNGMELLVLNGHQDAVVSAQFSPDGKTVLTTSTDKTARLWDAASGKQLFVLPGNTEQVSAQFSPDGKTVLTVSTDNTPRLWDAASGKQLLVLRGHEGSVRSAQFSPDGKTLLTASGDKTVRLWDAASSKELLVLRGHEDSVRSAQFSPDSRTVLTVGDDKTARLWDAATGKQLRVLRGHEDRVLDAHFSPDGKTLLTASGDKTARLWDAAGGKELLVLRGHEASVRSAQFSPDGNTVLTAGFDDTARLWDAATGKKLSVLSGHFSILLSAQFSPDGKTVLTASVDRTARLWDAATGKELLVLRGHEGAIRSAQFSPDGKTVLTASGEAMGSRAETARLWDAATGKELRVLRGHESPLLSAHFSPDGKTVLTASVDRTARLWDAATGKELRVLRGHESVVLSAQFSPDGNTVLTASADKTARLWDAATGKELLVLRGHEDAVQSAQFSPDGNTVLTASGDKTVRLWDAASGKELRVLRGHESTVLSAHFSPDGNTVLTASSDGTARLWDAASGKELRVLRGHQDAVESAQFSPDGKTLLTASGDKTARLWACAECRPVEEVAPEVARRLGRELTDEERRRFGLPELGLSPK